MNFTWSTRQRWWALAFGWLLLLVLGILGFVQQSNELDLGTTFLDHLYYTLQLAALDYQGADEAINWKLQIVRFAAPVMAAGTLLQSASVVFREQFIRWRAGRAKGHTVVCGLGGVGARLVEALVAAGRTVVAIENDPNSPGIATAQRAGVAVITGDATDPAVLDAANAERASRLVAITESDATNVAIAAAARGLPQAAGQTPLRCAVRLNDGELAHMLRGTELSGSGAVRLEFFNVHERAAQALVAANPPMPTDDGQPPHVMVFGLGQFGTNVVVAAAQRWADGGSGPLAVTLIDRRAQGRLHATTMQHPALDDAIDATCIDLDIGAPSRATVEQFERLIAERPPTLVVVAFEDEALAWTSALFVRRRVDRPIPIVVRTDSDGGFGEHLQQAVTGDDRSPRISTFGFLAEACSIELIEGGVREQLARAIHDDYVARNAESGSALVQPWNALDDASKESSRAAADAIVSRVQSVGASLVPLRHWGATGDVFTDTEVDRFAAEEHARWKSEREAAGWTWGERRDNTLKHNPLLVDWSRLSPDSQASNKAAIAALPSMLTRAGFEIERSVPGTLRSSR